MKKVFIRIICLLIVLLMSATALFSCAKDGADGNDGSTSDTLNIGDVVDSEGAGDTDGDTVDERQKYMPTRVDYNAADFVIAHAIGDKERWIAPIDSPNLSADAVNVAFFRRNALIETFYNVKVKVEKYSNSKNDSGEIIREFEIAAMSETAIGDAVFAVSGQVMKSFITGGYVYDVNTLDGLNLDASYYDQRLREEYNIEGKLFCLEGDFGLHDELRTHVVGVNKTIYDRLGYNDTYGSLYDLVRNNEWTLDVMLQMAKDTSDYATLGGNMGKDNQWGILSESPFPYVVFLGTGKKIINVDANGSLSTEYSDYSSFGLLEEMLKDITERVVINNNETLLADASKGVLSSTNYWGEIQGMFANGKALFRTSTLVDFTQYYNMKDQFGILPIPMYYEDQTEYYSWCSSQAHSPLFIPRNVKDIDRTTAVIEGMAYFSRYMTGTSQSLHDAFYENMTNAKLCQTADDYEMLELIFSQRTFDLDHVLNISNTCNTIASAAKGTTTSIPSALANIQTKMTDSSRETNPLFKFIDMMYEKYPD